MKRFTTSLYAAAGILLLAFVLNAVGPKRVMAALGYTPVRDVDGPGRQPFTAVVTAAPDVNYPLAHATIAVPAGKRLIVTAISSETSSTGLDAFFVETSSAGATATTSVPFSTTSLGRHVANLDGYDIAEADAGATAITIIANVPTTFDVSIHGYLVDVP